MYQTTIKVVSPMAHSLKYVMKRYQHILTAKNCPPPIPHSLKYVMKRYQPDQKNGTALARDLTIDSLTAYEEMYQRTYAFAMAFVKAQILPIEYAAKFTWRDAGKAQPVYAAMFEHYLVLCNDHAGNNEYTLPLYCCQNRWAAGYLLQKCIGSAVRSMKKIFILHFLYSK